MKRPRASSPTTNTTRTVRNTVGGNSMATTTTTTMPTTTLSQQEPHPRSQSRSKSQSQSQSQSNQTQQDAGGGEMMPMMDSIRQEEKCWKCWGHGRKRNKTNPKLFDGTICPVCHGSGQRQASLQSQALEQQPGIIISLRGNQNGEFAGVPAVQGWRLLSRNHPEEKDGVTSSSSSSSSIVKPGEILGALGCGDWRIFQLANGHKLTVDDFMCAWVAAEEMRRRGFGLVRSGQFGQVPVDHHALPSNHQDPQDRPVADPNDENDDYDRTLFRHAKNNDPTHTSYVHQPPQPKLFHHADLGCGCGSVLMMMAWAFPQIIRSHGVEAQEISFDLCRRGLEWNLGQDGSGLDHVVRLSHYDLRTWNGGSHQDDATTNVDYDLVTGTPPYFPSDQFVASPNHSQKIRCRIPTRGAASDYVAAAARLVKRPSGIICIAETARGEGERGMRQAILDHDLNVVRRLDVITRTGLPPRFSIWVLTPNELMTTPSTTTTSTVPGGSGEIATATNVLEPEIPAPSPAHQDGGLPPVLPDFPIETMTIRNQDHSRTLEYVDAMDRMGWVDFERTREKYEAKMKLQQQQQLGQQQASK